jgi:hypothetical protein
VQLASFTFRALVDPKGGIRREWSRLLASVCKLHEATLCGLLIARIRQTRRHYSPPPPRTRTAYTRLADLHVCSTQEILSVQSNICIVLHIGINLKRFH